MATAIIGLIDLALFKLDHDSEEEFSLQKGSSLSVMKVATHGKKRFQDSHVDQDVDVLERGHK